MTQESKPIWQSKTMWSILFLLVCVLLDVLNLTEVPQEAYILGVSGAIYGLRTASTVVEYKV